MEQTKIYPLKGQATAKLMQYPNTSGVPANMLPISDGNAFEALKQLVDSDGTNLAESDSLGMLASIGIIKGQPFKPDAKTEAILDRAAKTAYKMSRVSPSKLRRGARQLPHPSRSYQLRGGQEHCHRHQLRRHHEHGSHPLPTVTLQTRAFSCSKPIVIDRNR
jgi:hypothetical protein